MNFHNYTILAEGTEPKEADLFPIRNMETPRDIHQVRAFLGCCQQLSGYGWVGHILPKNCRSASS